MRIKSCQKQKKNVMHVNVKNFLGKKNCLSVYSGFN